ncbi:MAG: isoprenyl transferase [Candidatus Aminicenantes bacterium]|nr:isoprenyl transferase [Candidatus Aminicenantes bacterium]
MHNDLKDFVVPGSEEEDLLRQIDFSRLPQHLAIIMDGNGRWAKERNLPRVEGHRTGSKSVREVVETSARLGIKYLTLYAFSIENWKRPRKEVNFLWKLLEEYLRNEDKVLVENDLKLLTIGRKNRIPRSVTRQLDRVKDLTKDNKRMSVILAVNYGGRAEIVDAVKRICRGNASVVENLTEEIFSSYLDTAEVPDPDLLIRTSGELRISNFLLWQIAYAEMWITGLYWPEFRKKHLFQALIDFQKRERRFGDINAHPENRSVRATGST